MYYWEEVSLDELTVHENEAPVVFAAKLRETQRRMIEALRKLEEMGVDV